MSKRKRGGENDLTEAQLVNFYVKQLRSKLYCKAHRKFCFVRGDAPPEHEDLDDMAIGYWAQMIVRRNLANVCHC